MFNETGDGLALHKLTALCYHKASVPKGGYFMSNEEKILAFLNKHDVLLEKHSAMLEKQGAILDKHSIMLEKQGAILDKHSVILEKHSETLDKHSSILEKHSETLDRHSSILEKHTEILDKHSVILEKHSIILEALVKGQAELKHEVSDCTVVILTVHKQVRALVKKTVAQDKRLESAGNALLS